MHGFTEEYNNIKVSGLFGTASTGGGLFSTSAPKSENSTTSMTPASGGLFGAPAASTTTTTGGLFGQPANKPGLSFSAYL